MSVDLTLGPDDRLDLLSTCRSRLSKDGSLTAAPPLRVLCVDDNRDAATVLAELLRLTGYEARFGFDGREGWRIARRFQPDVCVIDLNMPIMSGSELARRLRVEYGKGVLLVALTCGTDRVDPAFDWVFEKPTPASALLGVVAAYDARRAALWTPVPTAV